MATKPWTRTIFRWAGSKKGHLPILMNLVPDEYERYIEPFAGSAALYFALKPDRGVLGDFNQELIHAISMLQQHPRQLHSTVDSMPVNSKNYYLIRDSMRLNSDLDRAARFLYLNRYCFNGIYRTNLRGQFNVPLGRSMGSMPSKVEFYRCSIALRTAQIIHADFRTTIAIARKNDFVYSDPPYPSRRLVHGEYGYGSFAEVDLDDLIEALKRADKRGVKLLVSYGTSTALVEGLSNWSRVRLTTTSSISSKPESRLPKRELLLSNYLSHKQMRDALNRVNNS
jgi:DNA adenine methylase